MIRYFRERKKRPCGGDQHFLPGAARKALELGDPADRQQDDVPGAAAEPEGGQCMSQFVEGNTAEEPDHRQQAQRPERRRELHQDQGQKNP